MSTRLLGVLSSTAGLIDFNVTHTGTTDHYVQVIHPNGKLCTSNKLDFS